MTLINHPPPHHLQARFLRLLTNTDAHSTPVVTPSPPDDQSEEAKASNSTPSDPGAQETAKSSDRVAIKGSDRRSKYSLTPVSKNATIVADAGDKDAGDKDAGDKDASAGVAAAADNTKDSDTAVVTTNATASTKASTNSTATATAAGGGGGGSRQPSRLMKFAQSFLPPFFYASPAKPPQPPEPAPIKAVEASDTPGVDKKPPSSETNNTVNKSPKNTDEQSPSRPDHKKEGRNVSRRSRIDVQSTVHAHVQQVSWQDLKVGHRCFEGDQG